MMTQAFAAFDTTAAMREHSIKRRELRPNDVGIEILYCGVCHTDLHYARNDWGITAYPVVPGHEIVGRVRHVGSAVTGFKAGDAAAVGTIIDSCGKCEPCRHHLEQMCRAGVTVTYNAPGPISGGITFGGYSNYIVVREEFVLHVDEKLDLSRVGPLLCAGITTYSPLRHWDVGPGSMVAVVGLGGLGHLAVKFAAALGADVTVITRSPGKSQTASELGADHVLLSTSPEAVKLAASSFDLIIDTVPYEHNLSPYIELLNVDGTIVVVGALTTLPKFDNTSLILGRRSIAGSPSGGIKETQEMLDFCAKKNVLPECEIVPMQQINEAFERMERGDVRYRFVIDMASLKGRSESTELR